MARPIKPGLKYFSLDVDIFEDDKIFDLQNEYGPLGEVIYLRLLCLIYKNGYYYRFDSLDKLAGLLIKSIGNRWARGKKAVKDVILYCAKCNLFSSELMQNNVITSRSIQLRYLKAKERNLPKIEEYSLLEKSAQGGLKSASETPVNVAETPVIATETPVNVCNNPTKESKENKSKGKESRTAAPPSPSPTREQLVRKYGERAVSQYEQKYQSWQQRKGISGGISYARIAEWLIADGIPEQNSSIDQEDILRELQEQYSEEG